MIASSAMYGQSLLHYAELLEPFLYFEMIPQFNDNYIPIISSGYNGVDANINVIVSGEVPYGTYLGIIFNDDSTVKDAEGNLVHYANEFLWAEEEFAPGKFIKWSNTTYRIMPTNSWKRQAGFTQYGIERIVGSDGQGIVPSNLNSGSSNYI